MNQKNKGDITDMTTKCNVRSKIDHKKENVQKLRKSN